MAALNVFRIPSIAGREPTVAAQLAAADRGIRRCLAGAALSILVLFGGLGAWAALAPLDGASVAPGVVVVDGKRKTVQHLEGGIVREILVREGDAVERGQPLMRLDGTQARAALELLKGRHVAALTEWARLRAERDDADDIDMPPALAQMAEQPAAAERIAAERALFLSRRTSLAGQVSILDQRSAQLRSEIAGIRVQIAAEERQLAILQEEIGIVADLLKAGNAQRPRLLALQRAHAGIQGQRGEHLAQIARAEQSIGENELRKIDLQNKARDEVAKQLREVFDSIGDIEQRRRAATDILDRLDVVAPQSGIVVGLKVFTVGGVIRPGEAILDLVPQQEQLIVEARVKPDDIDVVAPGLPARVRLTAYGSRAIDDIEGKVVYVSADRASDQRTGEPYYTVHVQPGAESLSRVKDLRLVPGMSAEVIIRTRQRTALDYLVDPISSSFVRAFRED